ncbi:membrane protein insertion efficiency factor YidD [Verticiella sediminum]|uniref:Putative membrane protein insertion efficiency factor n=2 Tax=Verticiella sediminum TaxID=1247510 RepID=A0A556AKQ9_9BURK|nr:membrane protein insertion efficiency factor YidD [Verticiella sediminum]TSH93460.1 membrane protein insertion efficiency factor YidD [Verticiella sediminum]
MFDAAKRSPRTVLLLPLRFYRYVVSPWLGPSCRFYPSCSLYAQEAIETHGAMRGSYLAVRRVCRCHPWNPGGLDPVPPRRAASPQESGSD